MSDDWEDTAQGLKLDVAVKPSVLIVDDDELVLAHLARVVAGAGYDVSTAGSGLGALVVLDLAAHSIVLTDLCMPGVTGLDVCRRIRAREWPAYVYIVLLTSRDDERAVLAGFDAGADDYVSKRSSAALLLARLRSANRVLSLEQSLHEALDRKHQLAMTDPLTGVYNRRYFVRHLGREVTRALRFGGDVALLLLDVDHFKRVNDAFGHPAGDDVLQELTRIFRACSRRSSDWCARLGGEEFAIVLEGTNAAEARGLAETVRQSVAAATIRTRRGTLRITVSIGVGALEDASDRQSISGQWLIEQADSQLFASKLRGRNCVSWCARGAAASPTGEAAHG